MQLKIKHLQDVNNPQNNAPNDIVVTSLGILKMRLPKNFFRFTKRL